MAVGCPPPETAIVVVASRAMGVMINGRWTTDEEVSALHFRDGRWERDRSTIRHWITTDGTAGPTGDAGFTAEPARYHLYVSYNCPWAHRTLIFRTLKNLEDIVSVSIAAPKRSDQGWIYDNDSEEYRDSCLGVSALWEAYARGHPGFTGRVTVPLLFDKKTGRAVNNESADIIRMLNSAFADVGAGGPELYPEEHRAEIDALNERIYNNLNNGVYRAGFARTQDAYEEAFDDVFETLDYLEDRLSRSRYLCGAEQTEADWRLFPTLVRFDVAYHYAFKCNLRRIMDYENLWPYTRDLYQTPGISELVFPDLYKRGYHSLSELRNPLGIVPKGPIVDFTEPHGRA
jgi:putative glutathione S-transferase